MTIVKHLALICLSSLLMSCRTSIIADLGVKEIDNNGLAKATVHVEGMDCQVGNRFEEIEGYMCGLWEIPMQHVETENIRQVLDYDVSVYQAVNGTLILYVGDGFAERLKRLGPDANSDQVVVDIKLTNNTNRTRWVVAKNSFVNGTPIGVEGGLFEVKSGEVIVVRLSNVETQRFMETGFAPLLVLKEEA